ncbi:MAG: hypothetical protein JRJ66_01630 [Deltaproteobacteria bacterium]|nr:hypothetical protein [Deltaproteobacteria bacterium]MBW2081654.1 hypothetical protein [Deltaproteobacteria bacterium]MBW2298849.1 hypothetical protein [Deltaproteobacteria bacterium]
MSKDTDKELYKLLFGVRRSVRYHNRRRQFFDRLHKFSVFLSALAGTATLASVLAKAGPTYTLIFAAAVAIFSVIDLVIGTAQAARLHHDLARRFFSLEKSIVSLKDPSDEDLAALTARRLDIEADEPPSLKVLDSICHNELLRALGYDSSHYVQIKWYQRLFAQLFDIHEHKITSNAAP